jgi:molecular chaperone GrpE
MDNEKINNEAEETAEDTKESAEETVSKKEEKEIESLKKELSESNDKYLRLAAEYDNYRKRTAKEKSDAYTDTYADAVKALLPVADSLDKALEFSPDDGIKALSKQVTDIFAKIGVTPIESDGKEFDPNLHNAIMHEEDETLGENVVSQTFQRGYMLGEKVIRHAMVKVAN